MNGLARERSPHGRARKRGVPTLQACTGARLWSCACRRHRPVDLGSQGSRSPHRCSHLRRSPAIDLRCLTLQACTRVELQACNVRGVLLGLFGRGSGSPTLQACTCARLQRCMLVPPTRGPRVTANSPDRQRPGDIASLRGRRVASLQVREPASASVCGAPAHLISAEPLRSAAVGGRCNPCACVGDRKLVRACDPPPSPMPTSGEPFEQSR